MTLRPGDKSLLLVQDHRCDHADNHGYKADSEGPPALQKSLSLQQYVQVSPTHPAGQARGRQRRVTVSPDTVFCMEKSTVYNMKVYPFL